MTSTVVGKLDYEGDTARIEGDSVPTRKMLAKVAAFLKARPMKGKNVVAQIIEEGDKAGWIEHVEELPLEDKMKKAGFGQQKAAVPEKPKEKFVTGKFSGVNKFGQIGITLKDGAIQMIRGTPELIKELTDPACPVKIGMPIAVIRNEEGIGASYTMPPGSQQPAPASPASPAPKPTAKEILEQNIKNAEPPAKAAAPAQEQKKDEWTEERDEFCDLLTRNGREGMPALLQWLTEKTDFFIAPSSTKYHDARDGGLLHHSVKVYHNLVELMKIYEIEIPADGTSLAIIALLHDVCKTDIYKKEWKPLPRRDEKTGELVLDDWGKKIWDEHLVYSIDDPLPLGHGEKSVIMLQRFIQLTDTEIFAIRWHMMAYDDSRNSYAGNLAITNASDKYRIIPLVHAADLLASFLEMKAPEGGA